MADNYVLAGNQAIFIQPEGANTPPYYLGCHSMDDIDQPIGDINLLYRPDPNRPNSWLVEGSYQGEGGPVETSIETRMRTVRDYLEKVNCPFNLFVNTVICGRPAIFESYERTAILKQVYITNKGRSQIASRTPDDQNEALMSFDVSAMELIDAFDLKALRVTVTQTENLLDITNNSENACAGICGNAAEYGDVMLVASAGDVAASADILEDDEGTIAALAADPFAVAEDIASIRGFILSKGVRRIVALRGTTDAGSPPEIAYSDDNGATWVVVELGSVDALYGMTPDSLYILDTMNMWVVTSGGYIFYSNDAGASWTVQGTALNSGADLYAISMASERVGFAVGETNTIFKTLDGSSWAEVTGPSSQVAANATSVKAFDNNRVWVGYDDGKLFYTVDGGVTWTERTFSGSGTGSIAHMDWINDLIGMVVHNSAAPLGKILYTVNGGYSWKTIAVPVNSGLNAVRILSTTLAFAVGDAHEATGMLIKILEA